MSKSKLTGIAPSDITKHFGVDAFRYYFMRAIPFGSDGSFSWEDMAARYTSELANDFGNLASRLAAMVEKYCSGTLPAVAKDNELADALDKTVQAADQAICALDFQGGINQIMEFCKQVNGYVTAKEPWAVAKDEARKAELDEILLQHRGGASSLSGFVTSNNADFNPKALGFSRCRREFGSDRSTENLRCCQVGTATSRSQDHKGRDPLSSSGRARELINLNG